MHYVNIYSTIITPLEQHIEAHWVFPLLKSPSHLESFFYKEILSRGTHFFILMPGALITCAIDTLIGCGMGFVAICTLGLEPQTLKCAVSHLNSSRYILAAPYTHLLHAINPEANLNKHESEYGICTNYVYKYLGKITTHCRTDSSFLVRHMISRLTYVLMAIACVISRIFDFIIGILAAIISMASLGNLEEMNHTAYYGLQVTGIVNDLFMCTIKLINPWATMQTSFAR